MDIRGCHGPWGKLFFSFLFHEFSKNNLYVYENRGAQSKSIVDYDDIGLDMKARCSYIYRRMTHVVMTVYMTMHPHPLMPYVIFTHHR